MRDVMEQHLAFHLAVEDGYKLTAGVGVSPAVQQLPHIPCLSLSLSLSLFCLSVLVLPSSIFSVFVLSLPKASLFHFASFCLHLSPRILPPPAPSSSRFIYPPPRRFPKTLSLFLRLLQWSYGFYLTHKQGQSGFEFFFKTKELKKKWLEQFGMAM